LDELSNDGARHAKVRTPAQVITAPDSLNGSSVRREIQTVLEMLRA
jgi:hypothetical protein